MISGNVKHCCTDNPEGTSRSGSPRLFYIFSSVKECGEVSTALSSISTTSPDGSPSPQGQLLPRNYPRLVIVLLRASPDYQSPC